MTVLKFPAKGSTRDVRVYPDKPEPESDAAYALRLARALPGAEDKPLPETDAQFAARLRAWEPVQDLTITIRQYGVETAEEIARMYGAAQAKAEAGDVDEMEQIREINARIIDAGLVSVCAFYGKQDLRECSRETLTEALREMRIAHDVAMAVSRNQRPTPEQGKS